MKLTFSKPLHKGFTLIERDGKVTQYVSFDDRAWHAGLSCFEGRDKCNDFAIGIELEGSNETTFYRRKQYQVLAALTRDIMQAYPKNNVRSYRRTLRYFAWS